MKKIPVKLEKNSYNIFIGENSLTQLIDDINRLEIPKVLIIADKNVFKYHSKLIQLLAASFNVKSFLYQINATEKNKSFTETLKIYKVLVENSFDRKSAIISIGGGITGDLSGYVASTYMRGIRLFQVPTTLLSMVDSSVGGKTGVNFENVKNIIGTFYQPTGVYIYPPFLKTLNNKELLSGCGEVFKYSFLADEKNYSFLMRELRLIIKKDFKKVEKIIDRCVRIKTLIVESDERETSGLRKILNLGHTFAHSFESVTNYKVKHGEAVIAGVISSLFLSNKLDYLPNKLLIKYLDDFSYLKINSLIKKISNEAVINKMKLDKKNIGSRTQFVLVVKTGDILVDISALKSDINFALNKMKALI